MIKDLLPRYYEAHGNDVLYEVITSTMVRNHEVAWMEYTGTVLCGEHQGKPFVARDLHCECYFKEGIGWKIDPKHGPVSLMDAEKCNRRKAAVRQRHEVIRQEYHTRFNDGPSIFSHISEIIVDLIARVKNMEFIEDSNGASFYGGYFYLQTVASIVDAPMRNIWAIAEQMVKEKKISLEGAVVQDYHKPPKASWIKAFEIKTNGWMGIAHTPAHSHMKKVWKFKIFQPDGKSFKHDIPKLQIFHNLEFGPDQEDVINAQRELNKFLNEISKKVIS